MNASPGEAGIERRVALTLALAVLLAIALLGGVRSLTSERAAAARAQSLLNRLEAVLHGVTFDRVMPVVHLRAHDATADGSEPLGVYRVRREGRTVAAVLTAVAPDGYSGTIELLVGVHADGSITGVRVLSHRETPGLGDRIERRRSDWISGFDGRSLAPAGALPAAPFDDGERAPLGGHRAWRVTRRGEDGTFDALSGATITSRAVVDAVHRALVRFSAHREEVLAP